MTKERGEKKVSETGQDLVFKQRGNREISAIPKRNDGDYVQLNTSSYEDRAGKELSRSKPQMGAGRRALHRRTLPSRKNKKKKV